MAQKGRRPTRNGSKQIQIREAHIFDITQALKWPDFYNSANVNEFNIPDDAWNK